jgi:hypothetical protein
MHRNGVLYDVGRVMGGNWRPDYAPDVVRRELGIIRRDLHCNAVKPCGKDIGRLVVAAEAALRLGLEVWFCPELWNKRPDTTLAYVRSAAVAAERLRARHPDRVVFSVGTELTFFMQGIVPGRTYNRRTRLPALRATVRAGAHNAPLNAFLVRATAAVRPVFRGPITYASLPWEQVDWSLFDIVGIDHFWMERLSDRYLDTLHPLFRFGKPVVITEFGFRTFTGAEKMGAMGPWNVNFASLILHSLPLAGRLVRPQVNVVRERNESLQARSLVNQLTLLESAGVDGAFVFQFVQPLNPYSDDPRHDLDTDSFSLVKSLAGGRHGTRYPDMTWEPKESFDAVAAYYATQ